MASLRHGRRTFGQDASRSRRERGAAAVEFALVAPILILLVMGIIDFGWMINRDTMINNVSRDAARAGSLDQNYSAISSVVTSGLSNYGISTTSPTTTISICDVKGATSYCGTGSGGYDANVASGDYVKVTITYQYTWITPTMGLILGSTITLSKSTEMIVE